MEVRHLEAFVAVVREGSFTRAAERLNLTQPSLSARVHHLEQTLGDELFTRQTRPIRLTIIGETFLPYAERVLGILDAGYQAVRIAQTGVAGRLAVGCPVSVSTYLMPQVVNEFSSKFPQAELFIATSHSVNLVQQLQDNVLDLTFTAVFPHLIREVQILLRLHDYIAAAVPPDHPLLEKSAVEIDELWQYRVVLPRWGEAFEAYIKSLRELSTDPKPMVRVPLAAALPMSHQANTITFMPSQVAEASRLKCLKVPEFYFGWDMVLITRLGRTLSYLEQEFIRTVESLSGKISPSS